MNLFENIKQDLPNFPDEIIKNWLVPIAKNYKWTSEQKEWEGILFFKTIEFWQGKRWKKQNINLNEIVFSKETIDVRNGLYNTYVLNQDNSYSNLGNGRNRFLRASSYLLENGNFFDPIYLLFEQSQYSVVDGNHRFVAWHSAMQLLEELANIKEEDRQNKIKKIKKFFGIKLIVPISNKQEVWVAY